ncbi:MAG: DNA-binding response regulator [Actinobacteria bacterium]|nr:DNA-binding response regulator [Actinomycetota bacterium]NDB31111.1 DNA-binding response regulator [Actinomycetota bacterium]NDC13024.1 DNA-binding response regulator [Actinomycetota bacterium]NDC51671.1 DNA-binding response regulator [Actinomycetota bacterium]NDD59900.1 DNA-binding response regulator [Actinomycetota bacterium]
MTLRVLVIDDHVLVREGLRRAISMEKTISIVGEAATKKEAITQISRHNPDVIVVDLHLPDGSGLEVIAWARSLSQEIGIVALTVSAIPEYAHASLESGASAFVDKTAPLSELVSAIKESFIAPLTFNSRRVTPIIATKNLDFGLTPRELEILEKLTTGDTASEIAIKLFVTESTIKTHLSAIYRKLSANNRVQAINNARKAGLLP